MLSQLIGGAGTAPSLVMPNGPWRSRFAYLLADPAHAPLILGSLALAAILGGTAVALAEVNALIVSISLLAWVFILLDFRIGVVFLIVLLPLSSSTVFPHSIGGVTGLNPLNLLLVGTFASCLIHRSLANDRRPMLPPRLLWLYMAPIALAALVGTRHVNEIPAFFQMAESIAFDNAGGYLRDLLFKPFLMIAYALLVGVALARSRQFGLFLLPMLLSVWAMALMIVFYVLMSGMGFGALASSEAREFLSPLGMHANQLGRWFAIGYALMLFTFAASRHPGLRLLLLASMGITVVALIFTFSRGAFIGFALVNVLFLISRRQVVALMAGALMLAGLVLMLPEAVFSRMGAGWEGGLNTFSAGRIDDIWLPLLPEALASPLFGHGLGSILWADAMKAGFVLHVTHPHNAWLQVFLDMGLAGLLLLGAYFVHLWRSFRQLAADTALDAERRGFYQGAAYGLLAFLLTAMTGSSLFPVAEQSLLWLAIGMMYGEFSRRLEEKHA